MPGWKIMQNTGRLLLFKPFDLREMLIYAMVECCNLNEKIVVVVVNLYFWKEMVYQ